MMSRRPTAGHATRGRDSAHWTPGAVTLGADRVGTPPGMPDKARPGDTMSAGQGSCPPSPRGPPHCVVAIAASAGGQEALTGVLSRLPADLPAAVLVMQHLAPHHVSYLAGILGRSCSLPVVESQEGDELVEGVVFV